MLWYNTYVVLGGELAVPCICNPLQQSRMIASVNFVFKESQQTNVEAKVLCNNSLWTKSESEDSIFKQMSYVPLGSFGGVWLLW